MRLAWLLGANAAVVALIAIVALLWPGPLFDAFGGRSDVGSQLVVRLFGTALLGEALVRAGLRDVATGAVRATLTSASFVEYLLAFLALLLAQIDGVLNESGYVIVALAGVLAAGYAFFRFAGAGR